jgi:hypothetical protein
LYMGFCSSIIALTLKKRITNWSSYRPPCTSALFWRTTPVGRPGTFFVLDGIGASLGIFSGRK